MCGIIGAISLEGQIPESAKENLESSLKFLSHRGPDSSGVFIADNYCFGHTRLSIIDLSSAAKQPMTGKGDQTCLTYNGEIYNYIELKKNLLRSGIEFDTSSDTEVLLKLIENDGEGTFNLLNGMFAFAFANSKEGFIVRDKYGIKPLYYSIKNGTLYFSSNIASLKVLTGESYELNRPKILEYLYFGSTLGTNTILDGIHQLEPGSYIHICFETNSFSIKRYVSNFVYETKTLGVDDYKKALKEKVISSVRKQLRADVPIGLFLSGGVDSTILAWAASEVSEQKINTYSARFDFSGDEDYLIARNTSSLLGTNHHEFTVSQTDAPFALQKLSEIHATPLGDYADIPLYLMSLELAKTTKVVIQGDGGDELFAGYRRYKTLSQIDRLPSFCHYVMKALGPLSHLIPSQFYPHKRYLHAISDLDWRVFARLMTTESIFRDPINLLINKDFLEDSMQIGGSRYRELVDTSRSKSLLEIMLDVDMKIVLPEIFFRKVDGATMAASIESRVPFLDDDLVNLARNIPSSLKVNNGVTKWILKESFKGLIPESAISGRKKGFTVPVGEWLKTTLYEFFWDSVNSSVLTELLDISEIKSLFKNHQANIIDNSQILWRILCLSLWLNSNKDRGVI